jgi:O-antigen/teichoic acid export membrane protein
MPAEATPQSARASLSRNVASNFAGFGVQAITTFALTPFVLRSLGAHDYGVWSIVVGLTGYYGLFDLGLRAGLTQYLTRHLANNDHERLNRTLSTGVAALGLVGLVTIILSAAFAWYLPGHFGLPSADAQDVRWAVALAGLSISVQFFLFPFSALLPALERFDLANAIGIVTRLITAAATYAAMRTGGGLVALSVVLAVTTSLDYAWRTVVALRLVPQARVKLRLASFASLRELFSYGAWNVTIGAGIRLISYTDSLVIGAVLGASAVATFAIAGSLVNYFADSIVAITQVFFPAMTRLDAQKDADGLRRLYVTGSRLTLIIASTGTTLIVLFAGDFLRLWVGSGLGNEVGRTTLVLHILIIAAACSAWQRIGCQVLLATRQVPLVARLFGAEAILNLLLSVLLVRRFGLMGVALGTLVPSLLFNVAVNPWVVCRRIELGLTDYFRAVLPLPALTAILVILASLAVFPTPGPADWPAFLNAALRVSAVVAVTIAAIWTPTLAPDLFRATLVRTRSAAGAVLRWTR